MALRKQGLVIEGLEYGIERRPFEEEADALALEIQKYTIDAKARAREEAEDMKFAADIARRT